MITAEEMATLSVTPYQAIGIPIALAGAVLLALGTTWQSRGVSKVRGTGVRGVAGYLRLLRRPSWLLGTLALGAAILLQLVALGFAPLIVVQPLGAFALVVTAILSSRMSSEPLPAGTKRAIALCVGGIGVFVYFAAVYAHEEPVGEQQLLIILGLLAVALAGFAVAFALLRDRLPTLAAVVGAGVLFGFVVTLAKVVINRVLTGNADWLTLTGVAGLAIAGVFGLALVQAAHARGKPDLVVAGLTVVDPLVAVGIGIVVLGEAALAPWYANLAFALSGAVAIVGVITLARVQTAGARPPRT